MNSNTPQFHQSWGGNKVPYVLTPCTLPLLRPTAESLDRTDSKCLTPNQEEPLGTVKAS